MATTTKMQLTDEFLSAYEGKQPKWGFGGLGFIVYLRTYARPKDDGTLEAWHETVRRFTEGNFQIQADRLKEIGKWNGVERKKLILEMERFFHLSFNLAILPAGRGIWMSGTKVAEKVGSAENNCYFIAMRPQVYEGETETSPSFASVFTFDMAMLGGGVGIGVRKKDVDQMPKVTNEVEVQFVAREDHPDYTEELVDLGVNTGIDAGLMPFIVPDSREGWAAALRYVIDSHYDGTSKVIIDVSDVRARGEAIKGFGGTASGPAPLVSMLQQVSKIISANAGGFVSPTQWGDVVQNIGKCVVAGNVRRTALILIGDNDDTEFVESKNYSDPKNAEASQWRWASNNSVDIGVDTDRETLQGMAVNIFYNGEPGYVNTELSQNYGRIIDGFQEGIDEEVEGFNPCGEITLPNGSPCNLFEINLPRIQQLIDAGIEGESLYDEAAYLAARYAYRVTFRPYEWKVTRDVVQRHRRLGVGITGVTDWALLAFGGKPVIGFDEFDNPIYNEKMTNKLDAIYRSVKAANIDQAEELDAEPSIKLTTVKPSGTVSLLMGVSAGQHYHWSRYMVRRVRMSADAPLVGPLLEAGYGVEPVETGKDKEGNTVYDYRTVVVSFPVAAPTAEDGNFQSAGDVSLKEQAALQAMLATYWADNAVSATLSFHKPNPKRKVDRDGIQIVDKFGNPVIETSKREELQVIEEITDILEQYKGIIKSTSLLPHMTDTFPQMPYEEISKETYDKMRSRIKADVWAKTGDHIEAEEGDTLDAGLECVGESCPVR